MIDIPIKESLINEDEYPVKVANYVNDRRVRFKLAHHDEIEIHYIRSGSGEITIQGKTYDYKANSVIIILSNETHKRFEITKNAVYGIYLILSPQILVTNPQLDSLIQLLKEDKVVQLYGQDTVTGVAVLEQINDAINYKPYLWENTILANLLQFFILLAKSANNPQMQRTSSDDVVNNVVRYINIAYMLPLTLENIAERFNISKYYLSRIFQEHTGKGFHDYLSETRVNMAKIYLTKPYFKIITVAKMVGFDDLTTFNRNFKRYAGETPSEFREKL